MVTTESTEIVIFGGGIMGLCIARALLFEFPETELVLFEKGLHLGDQTSGRNSGVLHGGIYYATGSLKHLHCVEGNRLWRAWCGELGVPLLECGKFIVASGEHQLSELEGIRRHAIENGVLGMRSATPSEMEVLFEYTHATQALFSPSTAVLDVPALIHALAADVERRGGIILKSSEVTELSSGLNGGFEFRIGPDRLSGRTLVNASGLGAVSLRRQLGLMNLTDHFVKGHYLKTSQKYYTDSLIYPLPERNLKGLGVHTTFDMLRNVRFGPDTREVLEIDYSMSPSLFESFVPAIEKTFKKIDPARLELDFAGIRPKIRHNGSLFTDFWIKGPTDLGIQGYYEICGLESPGLTAAPSIARALAAQLRRAVQ